MDWSIVTRFVDNQDVDAVRLEGQMVKRRKKRNDDTLSAEDLRKRCIAVGLPTGRKLDMVYYLKLRHATNCIKLRFVYKHLRNAKDPITLCRVTYPYFVFRRPNGLNIYYSLEVLLEYLADSGKLRDVESNIPFAESDLQRLDYLMHVHDIDIGVDSVSDLAHTHVEQQNAQSTMILAGLSDFCDKHIQGMQTLLDCYPPEEDESAIILLHANACVLLNDFINDFAIYYCLDNSPGKEDSSIKIEQYKEVLCGPPNHQRAHTELLEQTLQHLDAALPYLGALPQPSNVDMYLQ